MEDDFYPDILDVADDHGLIRQQRPSGFRKEVRYCCPFCLANVGKKDREFKLYINPSKRKFQCFRCHASGGVVILMSLLTGKKEEQIVAELVEAAKEKNPLSGRVHPKKKSGWSTHPAMLLNSSQWKAMGFTGKVTQKDFQKDAAMARRTLEWAWREWKNFEYEQTQEAFVFVVRAHAFGEVDTYRQKVLDLETEFGLKKLWEQAEKLYMMPCRFWPEWAVYKEAWALQSKIQIHDYDFWIRNRKKVCTCKSEHNDVQSKLREIQKLIEMQSQSSVSGIRGTKVV